MVVSVYGLGKCIVDGLWKHRVARGGRGWVGWRLNDAIKDLLSWTVHAYPDISGITTSLHTYWNMFATKNFFLVVDKYWTQTRGI